MDNLSQSSKIITSFKKYKIEEFTKSSQIWMNGFNDISKSMAEIAKAQFETSVNTYKTLANVKTISEIVEIQSDLSKKCYIFAIDNYFSLRISEIKLAEMQWPHLKNISFNY